MRNIFIILIILNIILSVPKLVFADEKYNEARGLLLYTTHCHACHTTQIHWRDQQKVTDWNSLIEQVRHWEVIGGLSWSESEIKDVANYLNRRFYSFKDTAQGLQRNQLLFKEEQR